MNDYNASDLISLEQALEKILLEIIPLKQVESIPLASAAGRITATDITSPIDVPAFSNSAMDGYAVRYSEVNPTNIMPVAGKAFAGAPYKGLLPSNSCIRIMTGAQIPLESDTVIMQEQAEEYQQGIRFVATIKPGQNIRLRGEDIQQGITVLPSGIKLGTVQLSLLASLWITDILVVRPLKVAIFATGDELQNMGYQLEEGQLYDTNRLTIRLMLEKLGHTVIDLGIIADNQADLLTAFEQADRTADIVISSGGVSVGEADYTKQMLEQLGKISFWQLAIKPGKPFAFGKLQNAWFCGLPGNPVSAAVTFYQLVHPLLAKMAGQTDWQPPLRLKAKTTTPLQKSPGRLDFQRGIFSRNGQGELGVATTGHQGSHVFSSFSQANCFIVLERDRSSVSVGEIVEIEPFNDLLRG